MAVPYSENHQGCTWCKGSHSPKEALRPTKQLRKAVLEHSYGGLWAGSRTLRAFWHVVAHSSTAPQVCIRSVPFSSPLCTSTPALQACRNLKERHPDGASLRPYHQACESEWSNNKGASRLGKALLQVRIPVHALVPTRTALRRCTALDGGVTPRCTAISHAHVMAHIIGLHSPMGSPQASAAPTRLAQRFPA